LVNPENDMNILRESYSCILHIFCNASEYSFLNDLFMDIQNLVNFDKKNNKNFLRLKEICRLNLRNYLRNRQKLLIQVENYLNLNSNLKKYLKCLM